MTDRDWCN